MSTNPVIPNPLPNWENSPMVVALKEKLATVFGAPSPNHVIVTYDPAGYFAYVPDPSSQIDYSKIGILQCPDTTVNSDCFASDDLNLLCLSGTNALNGQFSTYFSCKPTI